MISEKSDTDSSRGRSHSALTAEPNGSSGLTCIGRELVSLAIPILGANILGVLDGSINAMWIGRFLGERALAAASNANTILVFLFALALGIWTTLTIQIGVSYGRDNSKNTKCLIRAGYAVFTLVGIAVAATGEVLSVRLLRALEVPPESMHYAEQYLQSILVCVPISYLYGMFIAMLRGAGDTRTTFYFSSLSIGLDAGLNPILIFGLGPVPRLGIRGAALATVLSQAAGLLALYLFLYRQRHFLCLRNERLVFGRTEWRMAGELLRRGGPMGIELLGESLLAILMISLVNRFGPNMIAAFGAANQLWNCVMMPPTAVSLAATAMAAGSVGASNWPRVRILTFLGVIYSLLSASALVLVLEGLNTWTFALFLPAHSPALGIASEINRVASWSCIALAVCGALMGTPRAAGAVWGPFTVSVIAIAGRFVLAEALLRHWQAQGIWWSFPISGVIAVFGTVVYYRLGRWRSARLPGHP